jgi:prevent-host-death family protein
MPLTASKLRENIYRILDEAVETGVPVEIVRNGAILRIVPEVESSKLSRLKKRCDVSVDPGHRTKSVWLEGGGYEEWLAKWDKWIKEE